MCHGPVHPRALCPLQDFTKLSESTTPLPLLQSTAGIQQTRGINCKDLFALPPTATHNVLSRISTRSHPEQLSAAALCPRGIKTPNHHSPRVLLTALRCSSGPFAPLLRTEFRNPPQAPCPHCSHHAAPSPAFPERIPTSSRYSHAISPALLRDSLGPPPTSSPNRSRTSECGRPVRPSIRPSVPSHPIPPGPTRGHAPPAQPRTAPQRFQPSRVVRCPSPKGAVCFDCGYWSARGGMRASRKGHREGAAATNSTDSKERASQSAPAPTSALPCTHQSPKTQTMT